MRKKILFSALFILVSSFAFTQIITTFAGGGLGNGDSAIKAGMQPNGVTMDNAGNIYISTGINNTISKIHVATDILNAVGGNGTAGYTGDGGLATTAQLDNAQGVCIDKYGNIYEADYWNNVIRKIDTAGIISTFAGNGTAGYAGDGGPATSAELSYPIEVNSDNKGNIYIADYFNQRIRMVNASGIISTIAGNGIAGDSGNGGPAMTAELFFPDGVVADTAGNVYIADETGDDIRKVDTSGIISLFAGTPGIAGFSGDGGLATAAKMFAPSTVFVDIHGNIYFGDQNNDRVRMVNISGIINTIAGNGVQGFRGDGGPATSAELDFPQGVYADAAGNVYIADFGNYRVRMINSAGIISTIGGNGTSGYYGNKVPAANAELLLPSGVAFDKSGNMYIADNDNYRVRKVNNSGIISNFAGNGIDGFSGDGGLATAAKMNYPSAVAADDSGNIYIADEYNQRIRKVTLSGEIYTVAGDSLAGYAGDGGTATSAELFYPTGIAIDSAGNIYIADWANNRIRKVNTSGIISTFAGDSIGSYNGDGIPATKAELSSPTGVTVGPAGDIYIADAGNNRVRKVNSQGIISTVAGDGHAGYSGDGGHAANAELHYPCSVAFDTAGNMYISDNMNNVIRKVNAGIITTYAADGVSGFGGDGGPAIAAKMNSPEDIAVDDSGNLYIADNKNNRIRKVTPLKTEGINELVNYTTNVNVYPVPGNGLIYINLSGNGYTGLKIYDMFGKAVYSRDLDANEQNKSFSLNMENVSNGVYFVQFSTRNGNINKRIIIEK